MDERICKIWCYWYARGDVGERFCRRFFWNELEADKLPQLDKGMGVIRPAECVPGMEDKAWTPKE